jgi:hypothetical protein
MEKIVTLEDNYVKQGIKETVKYLSLNGKIYKDENECLLRDKIFLMEKEMKLTKVYNNSFDCFLIFVKDYKQLYEYHQLKYGYKTMDLYWLDECDMNYKWVVIETNGISVYYEEALSKLKDINEFLDIIKEEE